MSGYIARRLIGVAINLALVSIFVFFTLRLIPGDTTAGTLGESSTAEQRAQFKKIHGLDKGPFSQYSRWVTHAFTGNLGISIRSNLPVASEFKRRFPITMEVVILSFTFTTIIGVTGGVIAATRQDTPWDYGVRFVAIFGISVPSFLLLTLLLVLPARFWHYAPPFGSVRFLDSPIKNLQLMVPPTLMLAIGGSAGLIRLTRTAMLDVLRQDYLRTARSKGLAERTVIVKHAFRNAIAPVLTLLGLQLGFLLGGSIIVEQVVGLPGLGTWALTAIQSKDTPIIMAFSLYAAAVLMLMTLAVDLLYGFFDPRIRYS